MDVDANGSYVHLYCCFEEVYTVEIIRFNVRVEEIKEEENTTGVTDHFDSVDTDRYLLIDETSEYTYYYCTLFDESTETFEISNVSTIKVNGTGTKVYAYVHMAYVMVIMQILYFYLIYTSCTTTNSILSSVHICIYAYRL